METRPLPKNLGDTLIGAGSWCAVRQMKQDVMFWAQGHASGKQVSKETLNHAGLIELVSGLDVYRATPEAFRRAYPWPILLRAALPMNGSAAKHAANSAGTAVFAAER